MSREPVVTIVDIIQTEMELEDGQVMLENQRWPIPKASGLYVYVRSISPKPIGTKVWFEDVPGGGVNEVQQVAMSDLIQIDVMSADETARARKEEVLMALNSIYAEKQMEADNLQIARLPQSFQNAGSLEGTTMMNRFTLTMSVKSLSTKRKATTEYYDQIPTPEVVPNA